MEVDVSWLQLILYILGLVITATAAVVGSYVATRSESRRIWDRVIRNQEDIAKIAAKLDVAHANIHERINRLRDRLNGRREQQ